MSVPAGKDLSFLSLSLVYLVAVTMRSIDPAECFSRAQENLVSKEEEEYTMKLVGGGGGVEEKD